MDLSERGFALLCAGVGSLSRVERYILKKYIHFIGNGIEVLTFLCPLSVSSSFGAFESFALMMQQNPKTNNSRFVSMVSTHKSMLQYAQILSASIRNRIVCCRIPRAYRNIMKAGVPILPEPSISTLYSFRVYCNGFKRESLRMSVVPKLCKDSQKLPVMYGSAMTTSSGWRVGWHGCDRLSSQSRASQRS